MPGSATTRKSGGFGEERDVPGHDFHELVLIKPGAFKIRNGPLAMLVFPRGNFEAARGRALFDAFEENCGLWLHFV